MITNVLLLCADSPDAGGLGGVQVVTADLAAEPIPECRVLVAHTRSDGLWLEELRPERRLLAVLPARLDPDPLADHGEFRESLASVILGQAIDVLHLQSPHRFPAAVVGACRDTGVPLVVCLHDHALVCENYQLLEGGERYCGVPDNLGICDRCLNRTHARSPGRVTQWRAAMAPLLAEASAVVAPSRSVLEHALRVHPSVGDRAHVLPWGVPNPSFRRRVQGDTGEPLRVAVIGLLAKAKGAHRLPSLLGSCKNLVVEFHVFGATEGASVRAIRSASPRVVIHGAYPRTELAERLVRARCDVALLPSVFPESFSLTLSEVSAAGLPVIASGLGAFPERIRELGAGWTFDPWRPESLHERLASLASQRRLVAEAAEIVARRPVRTVTEMAHDHGRLWRQLAAATPRPSPKPRDASAGRRYAEGVARARRSRARGFIGAQAARLRHSDWYRDLSLRRALPETVRRSVEGWIGRLGRRLGSSR